MAESITPFLMFEGQAEAAIAFYRSLFADSAIDELVRYGPGGAGEEGTVERARFRLGPAHILCIDSPVEHGFGFTPALSLFVECGSRDEIERLAAGLAEEGTVLMPLGEYGFSRAYAWVTDRFGVAWQLNLA